MKNILVISRDRIFARCVQIILQDFGYECKISEELINDVSLYDAVMLDTQTVKPAPMLCPVIYTAYGDKKYDCEFFISRPFTNAELLYVTEKACRGSVEDSAERFVLDQSRRRVSFNGNALPLTVREYDLLSLLMDTDGDVSREMIIDKVFGGTATGNADAVYVNYLRKKLEKLCGKNPIISVRGYGYRFKHT